jgi:hypothetical protein
MSELTIREEAMSIKRSKNDTYEKLLTQSVGNGKKSHLPEQPMIIFDKCDGNSRNVVVTLSKDAVCQNMQSNAAAFESWILALKSWGVIDRALLRWEIPLSDENSKKCHYQRFLYRVNFFQKLFGNDWFDIETPDELDFCEAIKPENKGMLILNIPAKGIHDTPSVSKVEALLETVFAQELNGSPGLLGELFGLSKVYRQLPVGLFKGKKANENRIFTGGASAIDLVGQDDKNGLWIFELKKKGNADLGVITELMFYAACMRDLRDGNFKFHDGKLGARWNGKIDDIAKNGSVKAIFLLPEVHPLFRDRKEEILKLLNNACQRNSIDLQFYLHEFSYGNPVGLGGPVISAEKFHI